MLALHVTPSSNLASILAAGLKPLIGARSIAIESTPAVWLFPDWASLEDATWLYDLFEEDDQLAVLLVDLAGLDVLRTERAGYEVSVQQPIAAERLRVLCANMDDPESFKRASQQLPASLDPLAQFMHPTSDRASHDVPT